MGLEYYWKKCIAAFCRRAVRLQIKINPHPDEVETIPSRDADRTIKIHVYRGRETSKPSPVLINFCGSGFMLTSFGSDDEFCRYITHHTNYTVIDVQYRLAPEHPFPAAYHDAEDAVSWVQSHPERFDASRISLSGFSAGAALALAISSSSPVCRAKKSDGSLIRSVICFYGVTDVSVPTTAKKPVEKSSFVIRTVFPRFSEFCHSCYRNPAIADLRDPRLSPLYADPARFPPNLLIITAAQDPFTLEGEELAGRVREVGAHNVVCHRMDGCEHGWDKQAKKGTRQWEAKDKAYGYAADLLKDVYS